VNNEACSGSSLYRKYCKTIGDAVTGEDKEKAKIRITPPWTVL
jgi:hypothetical protein